MKRKAPRFGVVFDKDGTLFSFHESWAPILMRALDALAGEDAALRARLCAAAGYDMTRRAFIPGSLMVAGSAADIAAAWTAAARRPEREIIALLDSLAESAPALAPATPDLAGVIARLKDMGAAIGLATNDGEAPARAHLAGAGVLELFDFIAGADSGWGAKPEPGMLAAFSEAARLPPARCAMVGDSLHDLTAGRAAGFGRLYGVLSGPATAADLAPLARAVLPDVSHLPEALADWA